jgi:hypothetical protein
MDSADPRIRVLPHFALESSMLRADGVSLHSPAKVAFRTFLAQNVPDVVAFFEARDKRTTGLVTIDENSNPELPRVPTPPAPPINTQNTRDSWTLPEDYKTPQEPRSGVLAST